MTIELRDAFLLEIAAEVAAGRATAAEAIAGVRGSEHDRPAWGDRYDALLRLRTLLADDESREDFTAVVGSMLETLAHSFLVVLDGGTKLSYNGQVVWLTDEHGEVVGEGLHEWLPNALDGDSGISPELTASTPISSVTNPAFWATPDRAPSQLGHPRGRHPYLRTCRVETR